MIRFCSLFSGSSGNSIFLRVNETRILVDAGGSGKRIAASLSCIDERPGNIDAIVVTHEHSDHTSGIGVMARKYKTAIYANEKTWEMTGAPAIGIPDELRHSFSVSEEFAIGDITVRPFRIPHDAADPVGYSFFAEGKKITVATDIGHINQALLDDLVGSDMILLESNHDVEMLRVGRYPWPLKQRILSDHGHLSNEMAGKVVCYLAEKGTRHFMLGHLSHENNFPELAYQTVCNELALKDIRPDVDISMIVARRDCVGKVYEL